MKRYFVRLVAIGFLALAVNTGATVHYVNLNSPTSTPPFTNWLTAATNIQDAVDIAVDGDLVLVTNGVYQMGGRPAVGCLLTNRVVVDKAVAVQSLNGPAMTMIQGNPIRGTNAVRCVYLANGASLSGFTLTNGATRSSDTPTDNLFVEWSGGGAWCASRNSVMVSNCVFGGNSAEYYGGGAYSGTLNNCIFIGNHASYGGGAGSSALNRCLLTGNIVGDPSHRYSGGGVYGGLLDNCILIGNFSYGGGGGLANCTPINNCTIVSNSAAQSGGGVGSGSVSNSIVYYNTAPSAPNYDSQFLTMNYCCTTPMVGVNQGNFTNEPVFVDLVGGNLHLQSNSPCINAGNNAYVTSASDIDGNPRLAGNIVDVGAYEYQTPGSTLPYVWLLQYGLALDGSADFADSDGDGVNNLLEWKAGTNPTNALSVFKMLTVSKSTNGIMPSLRVSWQGAGGKLYLIQRSTNLTAQPAFVTIVSNLSGQFFF